MGASYLVLIILFGSFNTACGLFGEVHVWSSRETKSPFITRELKHAYFVGTMDNGTLACHIPGAVSYSWRTIRKELAAGSNFVFSWEGELEPPNPERPWEVDINPKNFRSQSLVVICDGKSGYPGGPIAEVIWVITRLHSPEGYITDPIICPKNKGESCKDIMRFYTRVECFTDVRGKTYTGSYSTTDHNLKCADWNMGVHWRDGNHLYSPAVTGQYNVMNHRYNLDEDYHHRTQKDGQHNGCRPNRWSKFAQLVCFELPQATRRSTVGYDYWLGWIERCVVPKCSNCMYGLGKGKLLHYKFRLPIYRGTGMVTYATYTRKKTFTLPGGKKKKRKIKVYKNCFRTQDYDGYGYSRYNSRYWHWRNFCSPFSIMIGKNTSHGVKWTNKPDDPPFCLVQKSNSLKPPTVYVVGESKETKAKNVKKVVKATCRIPQCTVRLVWFLFYGQHKNFIVDTVSSSQPRVFTLVNGKKFTISYFVFGIHLVNGMSIVPITKGKKQIIKKWKNTIKRVPAACSLQLGTVSKAFEGVYYLQYDFEEADTRVDIKTYLQKFQLVVKNPLTISLSPTRVSVCETNEGIVQLKILGDFKPTLIKWSYTLYKNVKPTDVVYKNPFIKVSSNKMQVRVTQSAWVYVYVKWQHGKAKAEAKIDVVGRPVLQNLSPLLLLAKPGVTVKIAVATNDVTNGLKWIHDAQTIAEVPDDPEMSFSTIRTAKEIIYILKIYEIQDHHYGVYTVKATNTLKCERTMDFILKQPPEPQKTDQRHATAQIPLTKEGFDQFKVIMEFMHQECADVIKSSKPPKNSTSATKRYSTSTNEEEWRNEDEEWEYDEETKEKGKRRKKRNVPVIIENALSNRDEPLCIDLREPKPYFEINLGHLTRIKGVRLLEPSQNDTSEHFNHAYRFLYGINGCQWKIYGIQHHTTSTNNTTAGNNSTSGNNSTNGTSQNIEETKPNLITKLSNTIKTTTFSASNDITWFGNSSLLFAKHVRLVPTEVGEKNEACIRVDIIGCSAAILEEHEPILPDTESNNVGAIFGGVVGGILGFVLLVAGGVLVLKQKTQMKKKRKKRKTKKYPRTYETIDDIDGSDSSEEHFYWEITN